MKTFNMRWNVVGQSRAHARPGGTASWRHRRDCYKKKGSARSLRARSPSRAMLTIWLEKIERTVDRSRCFFVLAQARQQRGPDAREISGKSPDGHGVRHRGALVPPLHQYPSSSVSEKLVETSELAHEVVETPACGSKLAQREPGERARGHRP